MNYTLNRYGYGAATGVTMPNAEWEEVREELRLLREENADLRAQLAQVEEERDQLRTVDTLHQFQVEVASWADQTFGYGPDKIAPTLKHLRKELDELQQAIGAADLKEPAGDEEGDEFADVLLLLMNLAGKRRVDLATVARRKFEVCKRRKWLPPDAEGVRYHDPGVNR